MVGGQLGLAAEKKENWEAGLSLQKVGLGKAVEEETHVGVQQREAEPGQKTAAPSPHFPVSTSTHLKKRRCCPCIGACIRHTCAHGSDAPVHAHPSALPLLRLKRCHNLAPVTPKPVQDLINPLRD